MTVSDAILTQILGQLEAMQVAQQTMQAKVRLILLSPFVPHPFFSSSTHCLAKMFNFRH